MSGTSSPAITFPGSRDLTLFPTEEISHSTVFYRFGDPRGPWWFSSSDLAVKPGRFDLSTPLGTCYLALDIETALREKGRERVLATNTVMEDLLKDWRAFDLKLPVTVSAAQTTANAAASFGANRELSTADVPDVTHAWAEAFHAANLKGIAYASRFTSGGQWNSLALFDTAGVKASWPVVRTRGAAAAMRQAGLGHMISSRSGVTFVAPPTL